MTNFTSTYRDKSLLNCVALKRSYAQNTLCKQNQTTAFFAGKSETRPTHHLGSSSIPLNNGSQHLWLVTIALQRGHSAHTCTPLSYGCFVIYPLTESQIYLSRQHGPLQVVL